MNGAKNTTPRVSPALCGARTRSGRPCHNPAGKGTDHVGEGRCKYHGGASPVKHGRYSNIKRERIRSLIEDYAADPDPLDVLPEIAAARALFVDYIERYDAWRAGLLAWHASFSDDYLRHLQIIAANHADEDNAVIWETLQGAWAAAREAGLIPDDPVGFERKPREVLDVSDAYRLLAAVAKIAQAEKKLMLENAISRKDLLRVLTEQRRVIENEIPDPATRQRVFDGFKRIALS